MKMKMKIKSENGKGKEPIDEKQKKKLPPAENLKQNIFQPLASFFFPSCFFPSLPLQKFKGKKF